MSLAASKVELETTKSLMRMDIDELTAAVKQLGPMVEELVTTHSSHCFCTRIMSALVLRHRPSSLRLVLLRLAGSALPIAASHAAACLQHARTLSVLLMSVRTS